VGVSTRQRNLALLALVFVLVVIFAYFSGSPTHPSALDAVPARSFIVATIDVPALRASPFWTKIASVESGMTEVKQRCGFDPLERAREVAVCVPEEEAPGEFGVVARADVESAEITACAEKLAEARGDRTRVVSQNGFTIVEDEGSERTVSRIAMRPGGPLIVGAGKWLDSMMDVARTGVGGASRDEAHESLRKAVAPATIVISAILPKKLRDRVRQEMGPDDESSAAMAGVLGVSQLAAAFTPGISGGKASLVVELRCESDEACVAVEKLIDRKRKSAENDVRLRVIGAAVVLGEIKLDRKNTTLRLTLTHDADDLARVVGALFEAATARPAGAPPRAPPRASVSPDEILPAKANDAQDGGRE